MSALACECKAPRLPSDMVCGYTSGNFHFRTNVYPLAPPFIRDQARFDSTNQMSSNQFPSFLTPLNQPIPVRVRPLSLIRLRRRPLRRVASHPNLRSSYLSQGLLLRSYFNFSSSSSSLSSSFGPPPPLDPTFEWVLALPVLPGLSVPPSLASLSLDSDQDNDLVVFGESAFGNLEFF